jgi:hypothetical protein
MNTDKSKAISLICVHLCASAVFISGCAKPNAANIALRKENQDLRDKIDELERARLTDAATIRAMEQQKGTLPTLPHDRLARLFTTQSIVIGRLSGGAKANPASGALGDDAIKVYLSPHDRYDDEIKAAGSAVIEAFDLAADPEHRQIGRWEFSNEDLQKSFVGTLLMYDFVLTCPLREPLKHDQITVHATFTDELTGRTFDAQRLVKLTLPPTKGPATGPTTAPVTER